MISGLDGSLWEPKQLLAARLDFNLSAADLVWHLGQSQWGFHECFMHIK
jgi:hypothetical protein